MFREIKARRVKWLGHHFRTNEHPVECLTFSTLYGTRRVGRPPIRWLESIEDFRNIGVGAWKIMSMDRDEWRIITGAVKAGTPLYKKYVSDESSHSHHRYVCLEINKNDRPGVMYRRHVNPTGCVIGSR
jgi:hypothetical protein